jgi:hypothetical protein
MTHLINRNEVFKKYKNIATEVSEMQKAFYNQEYLEEFCDNEKERNEYLNLFDAKDFSLPQLNKTYKVISFNYDDIKTYTKILADNLKRLFSDIGLNRFVVITHFKMAFVGNIDNKYPPLQKAFKKFASITNNIEYKNAIEVDFDDLSELIDIAFWIERCDANGPEFIFFHETNEKLSFNMCKYGNVHVIEYENELLDNEILERNNWTVLEGECFDKFSEDGRIKGRRLKI